MTGPGVLSRADLDREIERFGVAEVQVRRDHLISHVLAAIAESCGDEIVLFGGTALSRTHLIHARLSEDIDLIAKGPREQLLPRLMRAIDRRLTRTHGRPVWEPGFTTRDVEPAVLTSAGVQVRVQVLRGEHYSAWPVEHTDIEQRYADAPPARLLVPTLPAFAGWKTAAWHDRAAPRDLYDLWALAEIGALDAKAADLFARHGTTGGPPQPFMFTSAPTEHSWRAALAAQTRLTMTAADALAKVREGWATGAGWT